MMFVNLHSHDTFSRLDGYGSPERYAKRAVELGMPALAQTNHGNLYGAFAHYSACKAAGIKPIIGVEAYLSPAGLVRERVKWGEITEEGKVKSVPGAYTHLTVLAQNATGLRNLYRLHESSFLEGYYYEPRVSRETLAAHSEGLIVLSGCVGSEIATRLRLGQIDDAVECATFFAATFPGRYYIEIMDHGLDFEPELNAQLVQLADQLNLPMVATQDTHYVYHEDCDVHEAMLCLQTQTDLSDPKRFRFPNDEFYLKSSEDMRSLGLPESALDNTIVIAESVGSYDEVFAHQDLMLKGSIDELRMLAIEGLHERLPELLDAKEYDIYWGQLNYELRVIEEGGYAGYILAVADVVNWAKSVGILVGNGRGSGSASLVNYCVGITNINPIPAGLVFERFLNPERKSPPDIDTDFESARHEEIFAYAVERFGSEFTCRILTLGTIATKRAVQDAAKVLGYDAKTGSSLKSLVPPPRRGRTVSLDEVPEIGKKAPDVYKLAKGLDGQVRNTGVHAGGMIISPVRLSEVIPVKQDPRDPGLVSGYTMDEVEALGLVKIDFLAVKNLDVIKTTLRFIDERN